MYPPCNNRPFLLELCQGAEAIHEVKRDNTLLLIGLGVAALTGVFLYWKLQEAEASVVLPPKQREQQ